MSKDNHIEYRDPAELPEASYWPDPIDSIEPPEDGNSNLRYIVGLFTDALVFLADRKGSLVGMGKAAVAILAKVTPHRLLDGSIYVQFAMQDDDAKVLGESLYPVWEWLADSQGGRFSAFGMRAHILLALARPDLIDSMTYDEIGALDNATRQNTGKLVSDIRDILQGALKSRPMKSEETRDKCHNAQKGVR